MEKMQALLVTSLGILVSNSNFWDIGMKSKIWRVIINFDLTSSIFQFRYFSLQFETMLLKSPPPNCLCSGNFLLLCIAYFQKNVFLNI